MGLILVPAFAVAAVLYLAVVVAIAHKIRGNYKFVLAIILLILPALWAHSYRVSVGYEHFNSLCESPNRKVIVKTKNIEYMPLSSCSYMPSISVLQDILETHGGFECSKAVVKGDVNSGRILRYKMPEKMDLESCTRVCSSGQEENSELACYLDCLVRESITNFTHEIRREAKWETFDHGKISALETTLLVNDEQLAQYRNYIYKPFELRTVMSYFPLFLGVPAEIKCETEHYVDLVEVHSLSK